jgi:hypothetical protein
MNTSKTTLPTRRSSSNSSRWIAILTWVAFGVMLGALLVEGSCEAPHAHRAAPSQPDAPRVEPAPPADALLIA